MIHRRDVIQCDWKDAGCERFLLTQIVNLPRFGGTVATDDEQRIRIKLNHRVLHATREHSRDLAERTRERVPEENEIAEVNVAIAAASNHRAAIRESD